MRLCPISYILCQIWIKLGKWKCLQHFTESVQGSQNSVTESYTLIKSDIMLLSVCESRENRRWESSTFLTGVYGATFSRVTPSLRHSESKKSLGKICVRPHGAQFLQCFYNRDGVFIARYEMNL